MIGRAQSSILSTSPSVLLICLTLGLFACGGGDTQAPTAEAPAPAAPVGATAESPPAGQETAGADAIELEYWKSIKESEHTEDFWSYLEKYPKGSFADLAKARIERLSSGQNSAKQQTTSAPKAEAPRGDSRSTRRSVVTSAIRRELRGYTDRRLHVAPNIPRFKLDNVASLHGLDPSRVILLYDDGSGGGGKTGFCLTDRRMYWRFIAGDDPYFIDYEDISQVRAGRSKFSVNGYDVPTSLAGNSSLAAERFSDLIESISRDMRRR